MEDKTYTQIFYDIYNKVLQLSENPSQFAEYLTLQIRELIGTRMVVVAVKTDSGHTEIFSVYPQRRKDWVSQSAVIKLAELSFKNTTVQYVDKGKCDDDCSELLTHLEIEKVISIPLITGNRIIGSILLLDIMDDFGIESVINLLDELSGVFALVIRNANLYHEMENLVSVRTVELQDKNWKLVQSEQELQSLNEEYQAINEELTQTLGEAERINEKLVEAYLRIEKSELLFREILQTAMDGFWLINPDGRFKDMNDVACKMLGYTRNELLTLRIADIEFVDTEEEVKQRIEKIQKIGKGRFETKHRRKNGTILDVEVSVVSQSSQNLLVVFIHNITERKLSEKREKEFAQNMSNILESVTDAFISLDTNWCYTYMNKKAGEIFGRDPRSMIGKHIWTEFPEGVGQVFYHTYYEAVKTQKFQFLEEYYPPYDLWFENHIYPSKDGLSIFFRDITDRKNAEKELIRKEQDLNKAQQKAHLGSWYLDIATNKVTWTEELYKMYGFDPTQPVPPYTEHMKLFTPESWEILSASLAKTRETGIPYELELKTVKKDGTNGWMWVRGEAEKDKNEKIIGLWGAAQDITQYKQTEEELLRAKGKAEEGENMQRSLAEEISLNNARLESLLKIAQFQTQSIQQLLDFALEEAIKLTKSKIGYIYFYNEASHQFILNTWSNGVMNECSVMNPQSVYDLDKTGCWGEAVRQRKPIVLNDFHEANPIKKGTPEGHVQLTKFMTIPVIFEGKIVAVAGVANKETNYNDADIRQLTLLMDTVWKISERLMLIDNLEKAKEKAEESERLKSAFLANMSHEIRTPMNGILGFAELLKEPKLTGEEQQEYIDIIQKSGDRMLNIINDIVSISKVEAGQMQVSLCETNLNDLSEYIFKFFKPEADQKGIAFSYRKQSAYKNAVVATDREKIYAILTNLVKNAFKFTPKGETVMFGYEIKGDFYEFFVKDTGIGIPPEQKEIIFERFRQVNDSLNRGHEGAGLGLSISKAYVELLGGKIWVESQYKVGSSFYFTIPCNCEEEINREITSDQGMKNEINYLKILIAEDDELSSVLLVRTMKNYCREIFKAKNGARAVEICRNNPDIDLIMMDIQMPVMDGYLATQQIRQFNKEVIIIAQTAFALAGDRIKALEAGCNDYLSKPIKKSILDELMAKYFTQGVSYPQPGVGAISADNPG